MVKISIGKSVNINLGKKKEEPPPAQPAQPQKPVERRCSVCGNYTTTTGDTCPKCHSRL